MTYHVCICLLWQFVGGVFADDLIKLPTTNAPLPLPLHRITQTAGTSKTSMQTEGEKGLCVCWDMGWSGGPRSVVPSSANKRERFNTAELDYWLFGLVQAGVLRRVAR